MSYKVGDFVTFSFEYEDTVLGEWYDNEIDTIAGQNVTFTDIDGIFSVDVIEGLSEDQRADD